MFLSTWLKKRKESWAQWRDVDYILLLHKELTLAHITGSTKERGKVRKKKKPYWIKGFRKIILNPYEYVSYKKNPLPAAPGYHYWRGSEWFIRDSNLGIWALPSMQVLACEPRALGLYSPFWHLTVRAVWLVSTCQAVCGCRGSDWETKEDHHLWWKVILCVFLLT